MTEEEQQRALGQPRQVRVEVTDGVYHGVPGWVVGEYLRWGRISEAVVEVDDDRYWEINIPWADLKLAE